MAPDRVQAAVLAAQRGHECAYPILIHHLRAAMFAVYHRKVPRRVRQDDWYAEALVVLLRCVRRYGCKTARARFSTYFIQALGNRAIDLVRQQYTRKHQFFHEQVGSLALTAVERCDIGTDTAHPEDLLMLREGLAQVAAPTTTAQCALWHTLLGMTMATKVPKIENQRHFEQLRYRLKQRLQAAIG